MSDKNWSQIVAQLDHAGDEAMQRMDEMLASVRTHFGDEVFDVALTCTALFRHELTLYSICSTFAPPQLADMMSEQCQAMTARIIASLCMPLKGKVGGEEKLTELINLISHVNDAYGELVVKAQTIANPQRNPDNEGN